MNDHSHPRDQLAEYALGTLPEEERSEVRAHLLTCAECRLELVGHEQAVAQVALAAPQHTAPAQLKQRVLANALPLKSERPSWGAVFQRPAFAIASLALIAALAVSNVLLWGQLQKQDQPAETPAITLENTGKLPAGTAQLIISNDGLHATLIVEQLPALTVDQQYQFWLIRAGQPISAGIFSVNDEGYYALPITSDIQLASYEAFGVSIEPVGGSETPTGDIVLYQEREI
jgi:anti-sigma-K factor RskA